MNRFLNALNLRTKIVGTAVLILLIFSISSGYTLYSMAGISNELTLISEKDLPLTQVISEVTVHQLEQTIAYGNAIRFAYSDGVKSASVKESIGRFRTLSIAVDEEIERAHDIAISANETSDERTRSEFEKIDAAIKDITVSHKAFEQEVEQAFDALLRADFETVGSVSASIDDHAEELDHALEDLQQEIVAFTRQSAVIATAHEKTALNTTMFLVAISIVVGLLVSWIVASAIIRGIRKAIVTASGDLSQEIVVDSRDEVGELLEAMNGMRQQLLAMIGQISNITAELAAAAEEMSVITEQTAHTIDQQGNETGQLSTAIHEMSATAQEIARNISDTATAVTEANQHAQEGRSTVEKSIDEIHALSDEIEVSTQAIKRLEETSATIGGVLQVIQSIAEQTNLLALNAAIEAARAGDHGRGFAVVADEVRALASRTHSSTREIDEMIGKLQSVSHEAVTSMDNNRKQVGKTVEFAAGAGTKLATITQVMSSINEMATQIASASEQQVGVTEEVNSNIVRLNAMSEQTAQGAEETATAGRDLTRMASELQSIVVQFRT
ncbi:methyl-accepting chemotaxis protein [Marinobacter salarius]|uniref:methyl-accepting chemotaxis protein n=1 Tax=Marinobacter TaxID=2742 RepID=UPI001D18E25E|nr:methyl-accepting chemotaxis protein [Marinobacter salarius]MCC4284107.1 methyl-accepting chemotaxis protein [Marinobacter salarius]